MLEDLAALDPGRWTSLSYADLLADTPGTISRLLDFAGIAPDAALSERLRRPLPHSQYTHTPPVADKWRINAAEIERSPADVRWRPWSRLQALGEAPDFRHGAAREQSARAERPPIPCKDCMRRQSGCRSSLAGTPGSGAWRGRRAVISACKAFEERARHETQGLCGGGDGPGLDVGVFLRRRAGAAAKPDVQAAKPTLFD
ncbi:hypothetical protein ACRAWD_22460 [Caulobacter segnis]